MIVPSTRFFIYRALAVAWIVVVVGVSLPGVAQAAPARTIVVLGDSLSAAYGIEARAGWVNLLEQRLAEQKLTYKVVNASVSGDTTAGGVARLPRLLSEHQPAIVLLELGGNDGLRGMPPSQAKQNLSAMITRAKASGAKVLLLGVRLPPNFGTQYNQRFQQMYTEVAAEQHVPLVPFILEGLTPNATHVQSDGIHPTAAAQPLILENVWPRLRTLLEQPR
jgi:acyl-CoA thioesterase I